MVMATKTPQGARLNPQNTLELSQGMPIQVAIDTANAHGGEWTILLYPGAPYREGDITHVGIANITIKSMGPERAVIAPAVAPAAGVIICGAILTLDGVDVIAPTAAFPALRVEGGTCTCLNHCEFRFVGAGGDSIQMVNGILTMYNCLVLTGDIDLSTNACTLNMYYCRINADPIDTAGALIHNITLVECDFNGQNINSAATGATVITMRGCSNIGALTHAGTGAVTIRDSEVASINMTAAGTVVAYGGYIGAVTRAAGSVVWWLDGATIKVLPSATITDGMIDYALAAAGAAGGKITIRLATGDYEEDNLTLRDDVNIVGEGHTVASGSHIIIDSANDIFLVSAVQSSLRHLRVTQNGDGDIFLINDDAAVVHLDDVIFAAATGNAVTMTAGTFSANNSISNNGDYNLGTSACTLILHRCSVDSGNIVTAGAFNHVITLESVNMNGGTITNGATGATTIVIIKSYDINTFTDASLLGTVNIEASVILAATKSGTSPWLVRIGEFASLTNTNAAGEIIVYGGIALTVNCSAGIIRLMACLYQWINRTATGNIVDRSPFLADMPWKVHKWGWMTALANADVAVRGDPLDAGSGQVLLEVETSGDADFEAVEANPEGGGALGNEFTPARTPRFLTQIVVDNLHATTTMFFGLRETLGDYVPDITAEECAGFDWDGTDFRAISSDGAGVGVATPLAAPSLNAQHQLEVIIFGGIQVEFYVDGALVATHDTVPGIPDAAMDWQHLLETPGSGAPADIDVTIRNGGCLECPA